MKSQPLPKLSHQADFYYIPNMGTSLFEVKAGAPNGVTMSTLHCLVDSLTSLAKGGFDDGIEPSTAYAMRVMLDMVYGLLKSLEVAK